MKKLLLVALVLITAVSCEKDNDNGDQLKIPIIYFGNTLDLRVQDSQTNDLLNPQTEGNYVNTDIEIQQSQDEANAVSILKEPNSEYYYLSLHINYPAVDIDKGKEYEEELITKIKFGSNQTDEIKALYEIKYNQNDDSGYGTGSGYTVIIQKAWFNNNLIYDKQTAEGSDWQLPIIVKEPNS